MKLIAAMLVIVFTVSGCKYLGTVSNGTNFTSVYNPKNPNP